MLAEDRVVVAWAMGVAVGAGAVVGVGSIAQALHNRANEKRVTIIRVSLSIVLCCILMVLAMVYGVIPIAFRFGAPR